MTETKRIQDLLAAMTLDEKLGQMCQVHGASETNAALVREGRAGSIINLIAAEDPAGPSICNAFQRIAMEQSRLGIPLIFGRDVIHGYRTVLPIPLAQACSFDPELVRAGAAMAAAEARACGIHWTFAPMVDIVRDPRWGRVAEALGEDPLLASRLGAAMIEGFQGVDMSAPDRLAACAKHFAGYGAAEGGRDYNTVSLSESVLRDVYLAPFEAAVRAGAATLMSAFNELNGVPASGHIHCLRQILKGEWGFDGFVVSDWGSIAEMIAHGFAADESEAAAAGISAGVDMEMVTRCYADHGRRLLDGGRIRMEQIDDAVARVLRIKCRLGLFENPYVDESRRATVVLSQEHRRTAAAAAVAGCVLLENRGVLPLDPSRLNTLAVIGPLAHAPAEQVGCWSMDAVPSDCVTPLQALREQAAAAGFKVIHAPGLSSSRDADPAGIPAAVAAAAEADAVVLVLGEEAILSGEAHSRAFPELPGRQMALAEAVAATGRPLVAVVMAGRPLAVGRLPQLAGALLWAWHPGTMAGPALADLLLGRVAPSGRLAMSFPTAVGQIPVYYNSKNTGRPPAATTRVGVPDGTPLDPKAFTATYVDCSHLPRYVFGHGLTYTTFAYSDLNVSPSAVRLGDALNVRVTLRNTGGREGTEVVQVYVRDRVGSTTRPVRELKEFRRVTLAAGASATVTFALHTDALAFHACEGDPNALVRRTEPGQFDLWVGGSSTAELHAAFSVVP